MTPVFGHGHLRLYLLSLLAEEPRHGYDLILALERSFGGTYVPSAGTIYPRLAKLEEDGLVSKSTDGRKTIYSITDAGRAELAARSGELDGIENELTDSVRRLADEVRSSVTGAMKTLRADLASAARDARAEARADAKTARASGWNAASGPKAVRGESRAQLARAEVVLAEFRHQVRSELRGHVASGDLSAETVDQLQTLLDDVRHTVVSSLTAPDV